jgi:hypothetical protein
VAAPQAKRVEALTELTDVAATFLEAAGVKPYPGMQGRSFWPLLTGREAPPDPRGPRTDVYCEYYNAMPWHRDPTPHATMVRTDRHKLVAFHGEALGELYDLEVDPAETTNLWTSAPHAPLRWSSCSACATAWPGPSIPCRCAEHPGEGMCISLNDPDRRERRGEFRSVAEHAISCLCLLCRPYGWLAWELQHTLTSRFSRRAAD